MSVPTETSSVEYTGDSVVEVFDVPFPFAENSHIVVKKVLISTGAETVQVEGVDYTLTGAGDPAGGEVDFVVAPSNLYTVLIERTPPVIQDLSLPAQGALDTESLEAALDYAIEVCQMLLRRIQALENSASDSVVALAGNGLTKSGDTLHVGAGNGIQSNADSVEVLYGLAAAIADVTKSAASAGAANTAARADHKHNISTAVAGAAGIGDAAAEGVATSLARSDHKHAFSAPTAPVNVTKAAADAGASPLFARADHKHDISTAAPSSVGTANSEGAATSLARSDHVHNHGAQTDGSLHAAATASVAGFMSAADKSKLDAIGRRLRAKRATAQTFATGVPATFVFTATDWDLYTEYSTVNGKFTVSSNGGAGYYRVVAYIELTSAAYLAGQNWQIFVSVNGTPVATGLLETLDANQTRGMGSMLQTQLLLAVGDYVEIQALAVGAATVNTVASALGAHVTIDRVQ